MITTFNFNQPFRAGLHEKNPSAQSTCKGHKSGTPNENTVQNQLNIAFLNVF